MLILTSPAKTLDFESPYDSPLVTQPLFLTQAKQIAKVLKSESEKQLAKTLEVSPKLAELNYARYQAWSVEHTNKNSRPAIFAYNGDIFQPMSPHTYTRAQAEYTQKSLRIISGLYGLVRPYDYIQPYRLEMRAKVNVSGKKDLYSFWRPVLTEYLNKEIVNGKHSCVLNLASKEYFDGISLDKVKAPIITVEFKQKRGKEIKNVGILAKFARGMMIEYVIKRMIEKAAEIRGFDTNGYALLEETERLFVFAREQ